jgi:hypothetical protein
MAFKNPFEEIGLSPSAVKAAGYDDCLSLAEAMYKLMSKYRHPDAGGTQASFAKLEEAMRYLRDPAMRKEFFEEYAGKAGSTKLQQTRDKLDEVRLDEWRLRELLAESIGAPYIPGTLQNLVPGTMLLVRDAFDLTLITAEADGSLTQQHLQEEDPKRVEVLWEQTGTGRPFVQTRGGRAYCWSDSRPTKAKPGFWRVAPADETGTQQVTPLTPLGKKAPLPYRLSVCLGKTTSRTRDKALAGINSTSERRSMSAEALSFGDAQRLSFFPEMNYQLIAVYPERVGNKFIIAGEIDGGVIVDPRKS